MRETCLVVDACGDQRLLLPPQLSPLHLLLDRDQLLLPLELQLAHPDQILGDFHQPLLALLLDEARPKDQVLVELLHGLFKVAGQLDLYFFEVLCTNP